MKNAFGLVILCLFILLFACKKDTFITTPAAQITITADTLKYDTIFTATGSVTQSFKIININDQKLKIASIRLMGGASSAYKINVDGFVGPEVDNIDIAANDSIYVFVSVIIDQNSNNLPFIIQDSIQVSYNGRTRWVQLEAWGQNAHFFQSRAISADETWSNDLPYVILGGLRVDSNVTLTIDKGCKVYVHADAPILVDGTLLINGEKDSADRVYFRGDRLDDPYKDFPASWPGIFFNTNSKDNVLTFAVFKNAYQAIAAQDPSPDLNPKVTLNQCIIDNAYDAGVITLHSSVNATNCLISNCGKNLYLLMGGDYEFVHCTVASYSNNFILHKQPVLLVSNYVNLNNVPQSAPLNAVFRNCIFWGENGTVDDEVVVAKDNGSALAVNFDYNFWKVQTTDPTTVGGVTATGIINNQAPLFDSISTSTNYYDFHLQPASPAINKGTDAGILNDLDGKPRPVGLPDLGCYEEQ